MLSAFVNAFRTPDLRRKLLFVLMIIVIFRAGSQIPAPGVHVSNVEKCIDIAKEGENAGLYSLVNLFSGGALLQLTIFALGIMPYITASIILQLLVVVIPRLEALKKEGQAGQTKITQYTRYLTLGLAVLQATGIVALARTGNLLQGCEEPLLHSDNTKTFLVMVVTMTAGTAVIMWLGELITERGVGNGMSILIFTQVVATFPISLWQVKITQGWWTFGVVIAIGMALIAAVIFIEQAQRRIPVQYARRMVGRKMFGGSSTYIPLKVNQAGIIPVIFASSLLYLPALATQFDRDGSSPVTRWIGDHLVNGDHPIDMVVGFSHEAVGREIGRFLIESGYRRPFVATATGIRASARHRGLEACFRESGRQAPPFRCYEPPTSITQGRAALACVLESGWDTDVIVCSSDWMALGVIAEAKQRNLQVPRDVAVIGFGNSSLVNELEPLLTTIAIDGGAIAREAVSLLLNKARGQSSATPVVDVGYSLVRRGSA